MLAVAVLSAGQRPLQASAVNVGRVRPASSSAPRTASSVMPKSVLSGMDQAWRVA